MLIYLIGGVIMWYFMFNSEFMLQVCLISFCHSFGDGSKSLFRINCKVFTQTCSFILPLFALANTAIVIGADIVETLTQHYSMELRWD
jgi:NhaA family Na+:H+ antiporter